MNGWGLDCAEQLDPRYKVNLYDLTCGKVWLPSLTIHFKDTINTVRVHLDLFQLVFHPFLIKRHRYWKMLQASVGLKKTSTGWLSSPEVLRVATHDSRFSIILCSVCVLVFLLLIFNQCQSCVTEWVSQVCCCCSRNDTPHNNSLILRCK